MRVAINGWKGVHTGGAHNTSVVPAMLGFSGDVRHVSVPEFIQGSTEAQSRTAGAVAAAILVPVIPGDKKSMGNSLTVTAEGATGYGISDQYSGLTGGVVFPTLANPLNLVPVPTFNQDIDNGIASYDSDGVLRFIKWTTAVVGLQYYLPGLDRKVWVSGLYSHVESPNAKSYSPKTRTRDDLDWFAVQAFWDIGMGLRVGAAYERTDDHYADDVRATNHRAIANGYFLF